MSSTTNPPPKSPIWLITGASSGLGLALSLHVLSHKHTVLALVRSTTKSPTAISALRAAGAHLLTLDLSLDRSTIHTSLSAALSAHNLPSIDILVNNAAFSALGAIETQAPATITAQLHTNLVAPIYLIQACLPAMRGQRKGVIVNMSSAAGFYGNAGAGLYSASKFALEGLSESLRRETAALGVRVLLVEPGVFDTGFLYSEEVERQGLKVDEGYAGTELESVMARFQGLKEENMPGDPAKAARVIFEEVVLGWSQGNEEDGVEGRERDGRVGLRLPLGPDAVRRMEQKAEWFARDLEAARAVAMTTNKDTNV